MELATAQRLLPLIPNQHISSPHKPRVKPTILSPPLQFMKLYQELVLKEKEFIKTNPYAQRMAEHFASRRGLPRRKFRTPEARSQAIPKIRLLGVDGSAVPSYLHQSPLLRNSLDRHDLDKTWVPTLPMSHRRTVSIGETKAVGMNRDSLSPRDRSKVTTVTISLPTVLRTSRQSDSIVQGGEETFDQGCSFDSPLRRSRRFPSKPGVFPAS